MRIHNRKKNYVVYRRTLWGKVYDGQTNGPFVPEDLLKIRAGNNGVGYKQCTRFWNDGIQIHKWENVKSEVLVSGLNQKQAAIVETYYIIKDKATDPRYGYNMTRGNGFKVNKEIMEKLLETDDFTLLNLLDDEETTKNTHDENYEFVQFVVNNQIEGKKRIRWYMKKLGLVEESFTHYLRKSSDPGGHRYNPEFHRLWTMKEIECEGNYTPLF